MVLPYYNEAYVSAYCDRCGVDLANSNRLYLQFEYFNERGGESLTKHHICDECNELAVQFEEEIDMVLVEVSTSRRSAAIEEIRIKTASESQVYEVEDAPEFLVRLANAIAVHNDHAFEIRDGMVGQKLADEISDTIDGLMADDAL